MRPACVLFDLDGTLIDHFRAIHRCHTYAMTRLGLPAPTMTQVRAAVGGGVELAAERLVGPERKAAALAIYRPYWNDTMLEDVDLLPGAKEILIALRKHGARTAVFTNKHGPSSRVTCTHLGLETLLDGNFGATDTPWLKPDPAWTRAVLNELGVSAGDTLLVGDSPFDVQTAQNADLAFIGVATGTHTADELRAAGAARVCASLIEVARALGL